MSQQQEKRKIILATSFKKLLRHSPLEKITIENICHASNVHRSTFYRYFQDKYDLLKYLFDIDFVAKIDENNIIESSVSLISNDKTLFRNVSVNNNDSFLLWVMVDMISDQLLKSSHEGELRGDMSGVDLAIKK